jgi:hypothetical protein
MIGKLLVIAATACLLTPPAGASADSPPPPLDLPVPSQISLQQLLSTSNNSGDGHGVLPGAGACDSAHHQDIRLPGDDAAHNGTYFESWWWEGNLRAADGRRFAYMVWFASRPGERIIWTDYTLTDISNGTFHYGREPLIIGQPAAIKNGFELHAAHASATGGDVER